MEVKCFRFNAAVKSLHYMTLSSLFLKTCLHGEKLYLVGEPPSRSSNLGDRAFHILLIRVIPTLTYEPSYYYRGVIPTEDRVILGGR